MRRLKRLNRIVDLLNRNIENTISINLLLMKLNAQVEVDEYISKSQLEKDIFTLRMDFDVDFISSPRGICLKEKVDFFERLKEYLK